MAMPDQVTSVMISYIVLKKPGPELTEFELDSMFLCLLLAEAKVDMK
jgi:hypothetical protein